MSVSDVGAVVRPLNRPRLDEQQIVVGRIDIGPLKRLKRPMPNGLQTVVVQGGVEVVCITLGNYHVEPQSRLIVARVVKYSWGVARSGVAKNIMVQARVESKTLQYNIVI